MTEVAGWVVTGSYCECRHPKPDHDPECMVGWTGEPDEPEACDCEAFVHRGFDVAKPSDFRKLGEPAPTPEPAP